MPSFKSSSRSELEMPFASALSFSAMTVPTVLAFGSLALAFLCILMVEKSVTKAIMSKDYFLRRHGRPRSLFSAMCVRLGQHLVEPAASQNALRLLIPFVIRQYAGHQTE
jgi:hypothetical protein